VYIHLEFTNFCNIVTKICKFNRCSRQPLDEFPLINNLSLQIADKMSAGASFGPINFDKLVKSHFANDIEQFWKKIQNEPGVKNFKLFEGVSPSF